MLPRMPLVQLRPLHPALTALLHMQAVARIKRLMRGFRTPRRLALSILGLILTILWLGNAAISIVFRDPLEQAALQHLVPAFLLSYALWHVLKAAYRRPEQEIEWTPSELEFLCGGPFHRDELIAYKFAGIATSAILKAACFTLLMLPDLRFPVGGFAGAVAALLFIDLIRMAVEIVSHGLDRRTYLWFRAGILTAAVTAGVSVLVMALTASTAWQSVRTPAARGMFKQLAVSADQLRDTWVGIALESPFRVFSTLITAPGLSASLLGWAVVAVGLVAGLGRMVVQLDGLMRRRSLLRESQGYQLLRTDPAAQRLVVPTFLPHIIRVAGLGPLAWRQLRGALRYRTSLVVALAAPAVLACLPLAVYHEPELALLNVAGGLAFYSFVLLPSALKFDFRRDVERMVIFKSLPLSPTAIVAGQLAAPVLITAGFQLVVLITTMLVRNVPIGYTLAAVAVLMPLNVLIFALDNLIFLLYPHRLNQEGIEVLLRATLTFTAKGLLFAIALAVAAAWALLGSGLVRAVAADVTWLDAKTMFVAGIWVMVCGSAALCFHLLVLAYQRFDPSQDIPA